jgi:hypothetical protein
MCELGMQHNLPPHRSHIYQERAWRFTQFLGILSTDSVFDRFLAENLQTVCNRKSNRP